MIGRSCTARNSFRLPVLRVECLTTLIDYRQPALARSRSGKTNERVLDELAGLKTKSLLCIHEHRPTPPETAAWVFVGAFTVRVTPVPIPNTAVKPHGPMILLQRESRSAPAINQKPRVPQNPGLFLLRQRCGGERTWAFSRGRCDRHVCAFCQCSLHRVEFFLD